MTRCRTACLALFSLLGLAGLGGCISADAVHCADGTLCAAGLACGGAGGGCVDPRFCEGLVDGTSCAGVDLPVGSCFMDECAAVVCGDGRVGVGEACDDGNLLHHDGCTEACEAESPRWSQRMTAEMPSRSRHAMAYDARRALVVMFGGSASGPDLSDTRTWDGASWTEVVPAGAGPQTRSQHGLVYDQARGNVVMFGGEAIGLEALSETWSFDGATWAQASPPTSPPARYSHAMAYDAARAEAVVFGGLDVVGPASDTWAWDGLTWTEAAPLTSPPARYYTAMAYDAARARVVLFAGTESGTTEGFLADTWEWDGVSWTEATPAFSPSGRMFHAMAYDAARRQVVVFGGRDPDGQLRDLWAWDGVIWTDITPPSQVDDMGQTVPGSPSARDAPAMAYDGARREIVLHGGAAGTAFADTWSFRYQAPDAIDEDCPGGGDTDGDGASGCADPDCWAYCSPLCPPGAACAPDSPGCGDGTCDASLETPALCPGDCP